MSNTKLTTSPVLRDFSFHRGKNIIITSPNVFNTLTTLMCQIIGDLNVCGNNLLVIDCHHYGDFPEDNAVMATLPIKYPELTVKKLCPSDWRIETSGLSVVEKEVVERLQKRIAETIKWVKWDKKTADPIKTLETIFETHCKDMDAVLFVGADLASRQGPDGFFLHSGTRLGEIIKAMNKCSKTYGVACITAVEADDQHIARHIAPNDMTVWYRDDARAFMEVDTVYGITETNTIGKHFADVNQNLSEYIIVNGEISTTNSFSISREVDKHARFICR